MDNGDLVTNMHITIAADNPCDHAKVSLDRITGAIAHKSVKDCVNLHADRYVAMTEGKYLCLYRSSGLSWSLKACVKYARCRLSSALAKVSFCYNMQWNKTHSSPSNTTRTTFAMPSYYEASQHKTISDALVQGNLALPCPTQQSQYTKASSRHTLSS